MPATKRCPGCGAEIPPDAPGGQCASCLLAPGLESAADPEGLEPTDLTLILTRPAPPLAIKFHSFGDYELIAEVARGGMGVVFRARQVSLNRIVALKFIHPGRLNSPEAVRRFRIEAEAAASLNHPNIVTIYSVEEVEKTHFLAMELVEGRPLSDLIPQGGFTVEKLLAVGIPLTDALAAAHARGIGHRDLKPSNVMVNDQGRVKVIDFGLAKLFQPVISVPDVARPTLLQTGEGQILGTPAYISPEQIEGRKVDHRTDIFSLGILLCEMATARRPFTGDDPASIMSSILRDLPRRLSELKAGLPERLGRIIGRCLQKDPDERYQSALEVQNELKGLEAKIGVSPSSALTASGKVPTPGALTRCPNNLPVQLTSFIGRERETAEVTRLIAGEPGGEPSGIRLLTLTGPGGTGKTRLALQVATGLVERFPDGVWLVELAALSDPSLVPQTVATAMELLNTAGGPPLEPLTCFLAPKQTLLLLDNCEHLVAACADLADALLRVCPGLRILATSREGLRLAGETTWPVPSLSVPGLPGGQLGSSALDALRQYESVRLFVERARAVTPAFELNEQNVAAVARLCHRLDGIPLAIELAAARIRLLSVEQLVERVKDRFRLLTRGSQTALPRQQTLRALVDWSYDLLSEPERLLFDRLSVFAGGWTLEAAEAVCADDGGKCLTGVDGMADLIRSEDILDLLGHLLEKSMIMAERSVQGTPRFRLLETLRQYAQERLRARGEAAADALHTRHATHFAALSEAVASGIRGPDQTKWLERLDVEHDNLRAVLEWGKAPDAPPNRVELALRLAGPLYAPWFRRGHGREGRQHFAALLSHRNAQRPTRARAHVLFAAGSLALWQDGDDTTAWALLGESLSLAERLGDTRIMADTGRNLGQVLSKRGDRASARRHHEEALRLSRADDDLYGIRWSLENLAELAADEGDTTRASELCEAALSVARQTGDHHGIASILQTMGILVRDTGKSGRARELIGEGLSIMQRIGCNHCSAWFLGDLACVASASGDSERAVRILGAADALRERTGTVVPKTSMKTNERILGEARRFLSEAAYSAAWSEGRAMSLPQATAYAVGPFPPVLSST